MTIQDGGHKIRKLIMVGQNKTNIELVDIMLKKVGKWLMAICYLFQIKSKININFPCCSSVNGHVVKFGSFYIWDGEENCDHRAHAYINDGQTNRKTVLFIILKYISFYTCPYIMFKFRQRSEVSKFLFFGYLVVVFLGRHITQIWKWQRSF